MRLSSSSILALVLCFSACACKQTPQQGSQAEENGDGSVREAHQPYEISGTTELLEIFGDDAMIPNDLVLSRSQIAELSIMAQNGHKDASAILAQHYFWHGSDDEREAAFRQAYSNDSVFGRKFLIILLQSQSRCDEAATVRANRRGGLDWADPPVSLRCDP